MSQHKSHTAHIKCVFLSSDKNTGSLSHALCGIDLCCSNGVMYFLCVASAAHFLFLGEFKMSFAVKIKEARKNMGYTQQDLADILGIHRTCIAHYERGTAKPPFRRINQLCEALHVSYRDLFKG